jgi:hypothetical protein
MDAYSFKGSDVAYVHVRVWEREYRRIHRYDISMSYSIENLSSLLMHFVDDTRIGLM